MKSLTILTAAGALAALQVDFTSQVSIKEAARRIAWELMTYYHGNETGATIGILALPPTYYWWEAGAMWGTLVDYWQYTKDGTYNDLAREAMVFQGHDGLPPNSFMPSNWSASLGNDDQGFWGMSALLAAENNFPNPRADEPQWLALAQGVFNTQMGRIDNKCGGGLRWQIFPKGGYNYKNAIANGIFFNMGARLARFTGNTTYADAAVRTWDWATHVGIIDSNYAVYDGGSTDDECAVITKAEFTYNAAVFLQGAAFMYNHTNASPLWHDRVDGLLKHMVATFFPAPAGVAFELPCEDDKDSVHCNTDMQSFKGYMLRWMASTAQMAPFTRPIILPILRTNAEAAVKSCSGGTTGTACGFSWGKGGYDGKTGAGEQMSALAALSVLLLDAPDVTPPVTTNTGGTSKGDPNAGDGPTLVIHYAPLGPGDRAGAAILTIVVLAGLVAGIAWMLSDWSEMSTPDATKRLRQRREK